MIDDFLGLSRVLTGEETLSTRIAEKYLSRVTAEPEGTQLESLLNAWHAILAAGGDLEAQVRGQIVENPALGPLAKLIILLWYAGALPEAQGAKWRFGEPDEFFNALMWNAIKAHPPALSGGYFGHWKYPPET